ncbi:hypothetical protein ADL28_40350 [Streptomyces violaceusniger]|uniref:Uncharacterized protein n=1 Tax=Streptomyces violaceusniger TaxID=68280 RepID=A0A0X3VH86_STRVO|nr:hypothetical protein ADL28_40350 [Streptomyces violaceusniger]
MPQLQGTPEEGVLRGRHRVQGLRVLPERQPLLVQQHERRFQQAGGEERELRLVVFLVFVLGLFFLILLLDVFVVGVFVAILGVLLVFVVLVVEFGRLTRPPVFGFIGTPPPPGGGGVPFARTRVARVIAWSRPAGKQT